MNYLVETHNLSKQYGQKQVVNNVNMHIKAGSIYGFVGPNGAGKSTILKMFLGLIEPTNGEIRIFDTKVSSENTEILKRIGSIIENPYFYENLTAYENLKMHCEYMGMYDYDRIAAVLEMVGICDHARKKVKHFSLGMKQRLGIARAIIIRPELLILDEPINALDPEGIKEMRTLFQRINQEWGTTIVISSHILSEVEQIADVIGILKKGKLLTEVSMQTIRANCSEFIELEVSDARKAAYLLEKELGIENIKVINTNQIRIFDFQHSNSEIVELLVRNEIALEKVIRNNQTLEDYFFQLIKEEEV